MAEWRAIESLEPDCGIMRVDMWASGERYTDCHWGRPTYATKDAEYGWVHESYYDSGGPVYEYVPDPTHWQPLPTPPETTDD